MNPRCMADMEIHHSHLPSRKGSLPSPEVCASWQSLAVRAFRVRLRQGLSMAMVQRLTFSAQRRTHLKAGCVPELLFFRCALLFDGFSTQSCFLPLFLHRCNSPINIFKSLLHLSVCFPENLASQYAPRVYTLTISHVILGKCLWTVNFSQLYWDD